MKFTRNLCNLVHGKGERSSVQRMERSEKYGSWMSLWEEGKLCNWIAKSNISNWVRCMWKEGER